MPFKTIKNIFPICGKETNVIYLISYDIPSNRLRNKIASCLEMYGIRVQYSVFECELSEKQYEAIYIKLKGLLNGEDNAEILFYPLCKKCREKRAEIGEVKKTIWEETCIVI